MKNEKLKIIELILMIIFLPLLIYGQDVEKASEANYIVTVGDSVGTNYFAVKDLAGNIRAQISSLGYITFVDAYPSGNIYLDQNKKIYLSDIRVNTYLNYNGNYFSIVHGGDEMMRIDSMRALGILETAENPIIASGLTKLYVKSSDSKLYWKDDSGVEHNLIADGGGAGYADSLTVADIHRIGDLLFNSQLDAKKASDSDSLGGKPPSYYQIADQTLTDIAGGSILEDLINTANPWADNEVADDITVSKYQLRTFKEPIQITIVNPDSIPDAKICIFKNYYGSRATIDSIKLSTDKRNSSYVVTLQESLQNDTTTQVTIDVITADNSGTGVYYKTETTISNPTIDDTNWIWLKPSKTIDISSMQLMIFYHLGK